MKKIIIGLALVSLIFAGSNDRSGIWSFSIDKNLNGNLSTEKTYQIRFNSHGEQMSGNYININNDSNWEIKFFTTRGRTLMYGVQSDNDYYKILSGVVNGNSITGTWYDAGGQSGEFSLIKK